MIEEQRYKDELALAQAKAAARQSSGGGDNTKKIDVTPIEPKEPEDPGAWLYDVYIPTLENDDGSPVTQAQLYDKVLSGEWTKQDVAAREQAIIATFGDPYNFDGGKYTGANGTYGRVGSDFYKELLALANPG